MKTEQAEAVALRALAWMAEDPARLGAFLSASGAGPGDLARGARDPAFLGAVLDVLLQSEADVLEFAAAAELPPETLLRARAALPGGDVPHWT